MGVQAYFYDVSKDAVEVLAIVEKSLSEDGRIRDEKTRIHLYIWMDDRKPERFLFSHAHEAHHATLCILFGIESSAIRRMGS
jgi:hypothetical protein